MGTGTIGNVNSWEKFNRMVNVAKARNSSLNVQSVELNKRAVKTAPLSTKLYSPNKLVTPKVALKGGKFDVYA